MADAISTPGLSTELISATVQRELAFNSKLAGMITDVSAFAVKGQDTISFPKLSSFTVVDRVAGVAGDATALSDSKDSLLLDQNAYVAWIIDSMSSVQSNINAELENAGRAAAAQARFVDQRIIIQAETDAEAMTTISPLVTRDVILEMQEDLLLRNANLDNVSFWINPIQRTALLKIDEFTRADAYGSSNIPGGVVGSVFGVPVVMHNGLGDAQYFMIEKEGMAIGFQKGLSMDEQGANEFGVGAKRKAMDQLFGTKGLQIGEQGATGSALMVKDNN